MADLVTSGMENSFFASASLVIFISEKITIFTQVSQVPELTSRVYKSEAEPTAEEESGIM